MFNSNKDKGREIIEDWLRLKYALNLIDVVRQTNDDYFLRAYYDITFKYIKTEEKKYRQKVIAYVCSVRPGFKKNKEAKKKLDAFLINILFFDYEKEEDIIMEDVEKLYLSFNKKKASTPNNQKELIIEQLD